MNIFTRPTLLLGEAFSDFVGKKRPIESNKAHIQAGLQWLMRAQDRSGDGGVSAWYSLIFGWKPSYIETTGYIINTFLDASVLYKQPALKRRAIQMADFLVSMQHESGGYRTAVPKQAVESPPTVFNTGQDLLGLTDIYELTGKQKYLESVMKACDFLISIQEADGSWLQYTYGNMKAVYQTRVAWGMLKVWKLTGKQKYKTGAIKNLDWAITQQLQNGWFKQNHLPLPNPSVPYTHTIAYAIEGLLWSGLLLNKSKYIESAISASLPLANFYLDHRFLPGTFDRNWNSKDTYTCLTGDAQLALVWLELYRHTKDKTFYIAGHQMLRFLKTTQTIDPNDHENIRGAIKGSSPIYGDLMSNTGYCRFAYLNWATKFFIDALMKEEEIEKRRRKIL